MRMDKTSLPENSKLFHGNFRALSKEWWVFRIIMSCIIIHVLTRIYYSFELNFQFWIEFGLRPINNETFFFPCMHRRGVRVWKVNDIKYFMTLGHSNWTICSQQNPFLRYKFPPFHQRHAAFPFSCMQRKGQPTVDLKSGWHQGVYDPGAFKLDHLESTKPILYI